MEMDGCGPLKREKRHVTSFPINPVDSRPMLYSDDDNVTKILSTVSKQSQTQNNRHGAVKLFAYRE
jgi:hypothetical protein